jgi:hypothetical protein
MLVEELIEQLQKLPRYAAVYIMEPEDGRHIAEHDPRFLESVQMLTINETRGMRQDAVLLYARPTTKDPLKFVG